MPVSTVLKSAVRRANGLAVGLLALACAGFVWFALHWNLLNFSMNY